MQIVELKVNVEKSQLTALEAQVKALTSKQITIKVNTSGVDTKALNALTNYNKALAANEKAKAQVIKANAQLANSQNKVTIAQAAAIKEANRTVQQQEKTRQAIQKTTQEQIKLERQVAKGQQAQERANRTMGNTTAGISKANKEVSGFQKLMGGSLGEIASKMFVWQAMGAAVSVPIKAMKEAISTMKEVDSQMVQIQKVTNFSQTQMKEIEQQAYKTASAYGQSADAYLESVAAFARAGYKEQSAQLGELAVKTQLVGDTTAEVADQFLLSVDKAYKYNGSVTELMKVLDGADYINNNFATSLEKIAEGMGIVAPVAAQAHVGVDELMASIGTITAVTQRSGSEAARALRALFLNIIGDTKTEIEDGATWTAGEIEGLRDVLKTFVPEVVKAAEAANEVINPMEAIRALAEGMEREVIQEDKLMEMVSDIGGKLRSSQLLAIIQNWDMYEQMLDSYQKAAGTADKEIDYIRESWESKLNIMKNSWTEFVSHMVETDTIKGALDGVTSAIQFLDSDLGQATIKAAAFVAAFAGIGKLVAGIGAMAGFKNIMAFFSLLSTEGLSAFGFLGAAVNPVTAAVAAIVGMGVAIKEATWTLGEQQATVESLASDYESLYGAGSEYQQLLEKLNSAGSGSSALTDAERLRLGYLTAGADQMERQLKFERERLHLMFQEQQGSLSNREAQYRDKEGNVVYKTNDKEITKDVEATKKLKEAQDDLTKSFRDGSIGADDYRNGMMNLISDNQDLYDQLKEFEDWGLDLSDAQKEFLSLYDAIAKLLSLDPAEMSISLAADNFEKIAEVAGQSVVNVDAFRQAMLEAGATTDQINAALAEMEERGAVTIDVEKDGAEEILSDLEKIGLAIETVDGVQIDVQGVKNLASELGFTADQTNVLLGKIAEITGQSPVDVALTATDNASSEIQGVSGLVDKYGAKKPNPTLKATDHATPVINGAVNALKNFVSKTITLTATYVTSGTGPGGGGWGSGNTGFGPKATGDLHFNGGPVLLGDELSSDGSPRPELVITPGGKAFIAGMNGPVVTALPVGSRIFKYSDTMDVLSGRDLYGLEAYPFGGVAEGSSSSVGGMGGNRRSISDYILHPSAVGSGSGSGSASSGSGSGSSGSSGSGGSSSSGSAAAALAKAASGSSGRKSGSSGSSGGGGSGDYLEELKNQLALLRAQYDFLEASGAATGDLVGKSQEIQAQLHVINDYLRETGGEETDIVKNSTDWYKELEQIRKVQKEIYEKERDLYETEVELYEHQGKSVTVRVEKLRQIQDNLHREADYLRSIKASQADINRLSIEWWEIQEKILSVQQDLMDELDKAISVEIKLARQRRDEQISVLDKQIDALKKQRDVQQDQLDIEEKRKRVEEARFALENAQNERNVRYYNAATGQWEWGADASSVKSAQKTLADAEKELVEYEKEQLYDKQIEELEAQKKAVNDGFDSLESRWESLQESFEGPVRDIREILYDLLATGKLTDEQVNLIRSLVGDISGYAAVISDAVTATRTKATATSENGLSYNIGSEEGLKFLNEASAGDTLEGRDGSVWFKNTDGSVTITKGGSVYSTKGSSSYTIGSEAGLKFLREASAGETLEGRDGSVWVKNSDGTTTITKNGNVYTVGAGVSSLGSGYSGSSSGSGSSSKSGSKSGTDYSTVNQGAAHKSIRAYDSGGVLTGFGGIKATNADEIVIPPGVADFMLRPSAGSAFQSRLSELGYLYGATNRIPASLQSVNNRSSSSDHYGDSYSFGDVILTEQQARSTTVYQLARMSRRLNIYSNT